MPRNDLDQSRVPGSTGAKPGKTAKKASKSDGSVNVVDFSEPKAKKSPFSLRRKLGGGKPSAAKKRKNARPNAKERKVSRTVSNIAYIVLVTLAVIVLAYILLSQDSGVSSPASYIGSVFAPVQNALSTATRFVRNVVTGAQDYLNLVAENEENKRTITALQIQLSLMADDASENERLQALLDTRDTYADMQSLYAKVIGKDPGVWFDTFTINRGSSDGVEVNMPVITADGLAGRIYEVGLNYSKVMSVIDSRSAVACLIERTRDNGVMRGQISQESTTSECNMYYLPVVNDIIPGDVVLTSGVDMLFPQGLTVGTVSSVSRQSDLSDQYIVVLPAVDFLHLEDVLVLLIEVETDQEDPMPVLFTPTPRPTVSTSPSPTPAETEVDPDDDDAIWRYPSSITGVFEETPAPSTTPAATYDPSAMPVEDAWSMIGG
ncbi:MAG: rod shape-determining protein MreC [Clostridia bacterium]|nr:rod shape-determining protein MreC [Clostridia bacterium]